MYIVYMASIAHLARVNIQEAGVYKCTCKPRRPVHTVGAAGLDVKEQALS